MPIPFNTPDWLIQEYMARKSPAQEAGEGIKGAIDTYASIKQQQGAKQSAALEAYVKAFQAGGPQFAADVAKRTGLENPPPLPGQNPPFASPQAPVTAGTVPPGASTTTVSSPIIGAWNAGQTPPADPLANAEELMGQGEWGNKTFDNQVKLAQARKDLAPAPNTPFYNKKMEKVGELPPNAKFIDDNGPQGRGQQFAGIQDGQGVIFNPNDGSFNLKPLPGTGPIAPKVAPSMPGTEVSKVADLQNMKEKLSVIRQNYDPAFVGMFDSKRQAIAQKTGIRASKKAARFRQASQDIKDSLLRARSGAQINEQEYQRLLPIVPNENSSEVDFLEKLTRFEEVLDSMLTSKQQAFSQAGYRTPNFTPPQGNQGAAPAPTRGLPPDKAAKLAELRAKRDAGTLQR